MIDNELVAFVIGTADLYYQSSKKFIIRAKSFSYVK